MDPIQSVPVIDASLLTDPSALLAMDRACRGWGLFQVVRHGIPPETIAALQGEMRAFFALPLREKRRVERSAENPWGFFDRELTKNAPDQKQIFDCGAGDAPDRATPWPVAQPGLQIAVQDFMSSCEPLAFRILAAISKNLGVPADRLAHEFRPRHTSFLRLNYYPVCATGANRGAGFGVHHHTDSGALTVLLQDEEPGLEVLHEGTWHLVEPRSDALVVNVGDIVQVWSNDRYRAALHRVRASVARERYSAPFFFNPSYESRYAPLETMIGADAPARYRAIPWREFRELRAAGDYQDQGEEVQIEHYRIDSGGVQSHPAREENHGIH